MTGGSIQPIVPPSRLTTDRPTTILPRRIVSYSWPLYHASRHPVPPPEKNGLLPVRGRVTGCAMFRQPFGPTSTPSNFRHARETTPASAARPTNNFDPRGLKTEEPPLIVKKSRPSLGRKKQDCPARGKFQQVSSTVKHRTHNPELVVQFNHLLFFDARNSQPSRPSAQRVLLHRR
jgi:hypothetical protein